jgi:hypothetical protein
MNALSKLFLPCMQLKLISVLIYIVSSGPYMVHYLK